MVKARSRLLSLWQMTTLSNVESPHSTDPLQRNSQPQWDKQHGLPILLNYHQSATISKMKVQNRTAELITLLSLFILGPIYGSTAVLDYATPSPRTVLNRIPSAPAFDSDDSNFEKKSPAEKISLAKRWLNLPANAPRGLLWHTYWSRRYGLSINASRTKIQASSETYLTNYFLRTERLPKWCPLALAYWRKEFETHIWQKQIASYVYGLSPFLSEKQALIEEGKIYGKVEGDSSVWLAAQIIRSFRLPKGTSEDQTFDFYFRLTHLSGYSRSELDEISDAQNREDALLVFQLPAGTNYSLLTKRLDNVYDAIWLEFPDPKYYGPPEHHCPLCRK